MLKKYISKKHYEVGTWVLQGKNGIYKFYDS